MCFIIDDDQRAPLRCAWCFPLSENFPKRPVVFVLVLLVDVEFAVQFLVLSQGCKHPELLANVGNIALLHRAEACGLLPVGVGQNAATAYRTLRQIQHRARLNEDPTQVDGSHVADERAAGLALWAAVFEPVAILQSGFS